MNFRVVNFLAYWLLKLTTLLIITYLATEALINTEGLIINDRRIFCESVAKNTCESAIE